MAQDKKQKLETMATRIFEVLCAVAFVIIFIFSFFIIGINSSDLNDQYVGLIHTSIISAIAGLVLFFAAFFISFFLWNGLFSKIRLNRVLVALLVSILAAAFSIWWVIKAQINPSGDQILIYGYAALYDLGDYSSLGHDGYVAAFPQQLGIISLLRLFFRFWGVTYVPFQIFTAITVGLLVFSVFGFVRSISNDNAFVEYVAVLMTISCIPIYIYSSFVYGDVSSTAFLMLSAWMLEECLRDKCKWHKILVAGLAVFAAVSLRENSLIIVIGFAIVILVKLLSNNRDITKTAIVELVVIVLSTILAMNVYKLAYHDHIAEDADPMPAIMWIAMGLNYEDAGYFNSYNEITFMEAGNNSKIASEMAKQEIDRMLDFYKENPRMAMDFLYRKLNIQWNTPMLQSLNNTNNCMGYDCELVNRVYYGDLKDTCDSFMNAWQGFLYLGVVVYIALRIKRKNADISEYLLLVGVYGGVLFSMIWEQKTRYVFPYICFLIPYAACGIAEKSEYVCDFCRTIWNKFKGKQEISDIGD